MEESLRGEQAARVQGGNDRGRIWEGMSRRADRTAHGKGSIHCRSSTGCRSSRSVLPPRPLEEVRAKRSPVDRRMPSLRLAISTPDPATDDASEKGFVLQPRGRSATDQRREFDTASPWRRARRVFETTDRADESLKRLTNPMPSVVAKFFDVSPPRKDRPAGTDSQLGSTLRRASRVS